MKIKYKQKGLTITNGISFENFCEIEVSDTIGKELLKQKCLFEEIKEVKETKIEVKETKPKTQTTKDTKDTKSTKTTRTRKAKVEVEEKSE